MAMTRYDTCVPILRIVPLLATRTRYHTKCVDHHRKNSHGLVGKGKSQVRGPLKIWLSRAFQCWQNELFIIHVSPDRVCEVRSCVQEEGPKQGERK